MPPTLYLSWKRHRRSRNCLDRNAGSQASLKGFSFHFPIPTVRSISGAGLRVVMNDNVAAILITAGSFEADTNGLTSDLSHLERKDWASITTEQT